MVFLINQKAIQQIPLQNSTHDFIKTLPVKLEDIGVIQTIYDENSHAITTTHTAIYPWLHRGHGKPAEEFDITIETTIQFLNLYLSKSHWQIDSESGYGLPDIHWETRKSGSVTYLQLKETIKASHAFNLVLETPIMIDSSMGIQFLLLFWFKVNVPSSVFDRVLAQCRITVGGIHTDYATISNIFCTVSDLYMPATKTDDQINNVNKHCYKYAISYIAGCLACMIIDAEIKRPKSTWLSKAETAAYLKTAMAFRGENIIMLNSGNGPVQCVSCSHLIDADNKPTGLAIYKLQTLQNIMCDLKHIGTQNLQHLCNRINNLPATIVQNSVEIDRSDPLALIGITTVQHLSVHYSVLQ